MKKCLIIILCTALLTAMFAACAPEPPKETAPATTTAPSQTVSAEPSPSEPPLPDFSGTSFIANWHVSKLTASDGSPASEDEIKAAGADFTLELLKGGVYFVYNAKGKVLGQGKYGVDKNKLTLTAGETQTIYEILDENTIQSASGDGSVTTMSRGKEEPKDEEEKED